MKTIRIQCTNQLYYKTLPAFFWVVYIPSCVRHSWRMSFSVSGFCRADLKHLDTDMDSNCPKAILRGAGRSSPSCSRRRRVDQMRRGQGSSRTWRMGDRLLSRGQATRITIRSQALSTVWTISFRLRARAWILSGVVFCGIDMVGR